MEFGYTVVYTLNNSDSNWPFNSNIHAICDFILKSFIWQIDD